MKDPISKIDAQTYLDVLNANAQNHMDTFDLELFKRTHPKLMRTIISTIHEVRKNNEIELHLDGAYVIDGCVHLVSRKTFNRQDRRLVPLNGLATTNLQILKSDTHGFFIGRLKLSSNDLWVQDLSTTTRSSDYYGTFEMAVHMLKKIYRNE